MIFYEQPKNCQWIVLVLQKCVIVYSLLFNVFLWRIKKWNFKTCKRNIQTHFIIQECIFFLYTLIDEVTDRLTVYLNIVYFFGMAIIINGQSIFLHHKSNSEHCVKEKSVTLIFFDRNNNFKKPLFLKMLLLKDKCSYNYHYFFLIWKASKG